MQVDLGQPLPLEHIGDVVETGILQNMSPERQGPPLRGGGEIVEERSVAGRESTGDDHCVNVEFESDCSRLLVECISDVDGCARAALKQRLTVGADREPTDFEWASPYVEGERAGIDELGPR